MVRCAAAMEAGQVAEGRALAVVEAAAASAAGGGRAGGGARTEPAGLPCPRCESTDTKFCYYNNYNLSQPRHFCKGCRRYWTRGGALRNVPVGGGTRKATPAGARRKRSGGAPSPSPTPAAPLSSSAPYATLRPYELSFGQALAAPLAAVDPDRRLLDLGGSFSSLLAPAHEPTPDVHWAAGFLVGGLAHMAPHASAPALPAPPPPPSQPLVSQALPEGLIWSMGWPDLSI